MLQIPLRFRFLKVPVRWEIRTEDSYNQFSQTSDRVRTAIPEIDYEQRSGELDGWECRARLFELSNNEQALLDYLSSIGVWDCSRDLSAKAPLYSLSGRLIDAVPAIPTEEIWQFRDELRNGLLHPKKFLEQYAFPILPYDRGFDIAVQASLHNEFSLRFDVEDGKPAGLVTTICAREMLLATVYADLVRGLRFQVCRRKDCCKVFRIESGHKRKYCSWYCGHIESVRRNRR